MHYTFFPYFAKQQQAMARFGETITQDEKTPFPFFFFFVDVNECSSNPCLNGGTCTDTRNGFTCTCGAFVTGMRCESVLGKYREMERASSDLLETCSLGTRHQL